ncbi:DNA-binding response regulator [Devosia nitrariae]|uniref:DNA-binding response regulator n=2 Tax=Devosia nitrariae TaxID=2071872 RepID=A0ABQ5W5C3_9HYPH|nr:DNA-binding response regulator [Devosia nitrariae]
MVVRIAIADDHPIVLSGLLNLVSTDNAFTVVASAPEGRAILTAIRQEKPDIAVLDLNMPGLSGLEVLAAIRLEALPTRVALLTATISDAQVFDAVANGAAALVLKEAAPETLMDCLHALAAGRNWLSGQEIQAALHREGQRRLRWQERSRSLTVRELQIVDLILKGASNKEIAYQLQVSDGTAKVHVHNIFQKLEVASRAELLELAAGQ